MYCVYPSDFYDYTQAGSRASICVLTLVTQKAFLIGRLLGVGVSASEWLTSDVEAVPAIDNYDAESEVSVIPIDKIVPNVSSAPPKLAIRNGVQPLNQYKNILDGSTAAKKLLAIEVFVARVGNSQPLCTDEPIDCIPICAETYSVNKKVDRRARSLLRCAA